MIDPVLFYPDLVDLRFQTVRFIQKDLENYLKDRFPMIFCFEKYFQINLKLTVKILVNLLVWKMHEFSQEFPIARENTRNPL